MKSLLLPLLFLFAITGCTDKEEPTTPVDPPIVVEPPIEPPVDPPVEPPVEPPVKTSPEVYEGCEKLTEPSGVVYTIGKGMQYEDTYKLQAANVLKGGETLEFHGDHEYVALSKYKTKFYIDNPSFVHLDFSKGNVKELHLRGVKRVAIRNAKMTRTETGKMLDFMESSQIIIDNMEFSGGDSTDLTVEQWLNKPSVLSSRRTSCLSFTNNKVNIVRFGASVSMDTLMTRETNSAKTLIKGNDIKNVSGDIYRLNGSDIIVRDNDFIDGWVSGKDGDLNHDDMLQGFALNGEVYENILVENNTFIESSDYNRKLIGGYQGFGIFDGQFKNVTVRNNLILGSAYHGISLYGVDTALIENNTLVSPIARKFWISTPNMKEKFGSIAAKNVTVRNNIAGHLPKDPSATGWVVNENNFVTLEYGDLFEAFDLKESKFDFRIKSTHPIFGKNIGYKKK